MSARAQVGCAAGVQIPALMRRHAPRERVDPASARRQEVDPARIVSFWHVRCTSGACSACRDTRSPTHGLKRRKAAREVSALQTRVRPAAFSCLQPRHVVGQTSGGMVVAQMLNHSDISVSTSNRQSVVRPLYGVALAVITGLLCRWNIASLVEAESKIKRLTWNCNIPDSYQSSPTGWWTIGARVLIICAHHVDVGCAPRLPPTHQNNSIRTTNPDRRFDFA